MTKRRHILFFAAAFVAAVPATVPARPLDEVIASGRIRIAIYEANKPFSDRVDGKMRGIDVDIANAIAEKLKVKADIVGFVASEDVGGDFRLNLWKGDLAGSALSDVMLHIPNDRALTLRDDQVVLTSPYFMQKLALAYNKEKVGRLQTLPDIGKGQVAVEVTSASDIALMSALHGQLISNIVHFPNFDQAVDAFRRGEEPIIAGTQAQIQAAFHAAHLAGDQNPIFAPDIPGPVKSHWELAGAVRTNSRDLGYAVGDILGDMIKSGRMSEICARYGVSFVPPDN